MTVNVVEVAREVCKWADDMGGDTPTPRFLAINYLAMAKVVLAAERRVGYGHSEACRSLVGIGKPRHGCTCGHDALVAALEGK